MLIIVCGLPGTGKTTVAKKIVTKIGGILLRTDVIRKELIEKPTYSEEEKQTIYSELFLRAKELIKNGKDVILDGTFAKKKNREKAKEISKEQIIVEIICPENIIKERIEKRIGDESEANFIHYLKYKKFFEEITEEHIIIDTSKDINKQLKKF